MDALWYICVALVFLGWAIFVSSRFMELGLLLFLFGVLTFGVMVEWNRPGAEQTTACRVERFHPDGRSAGVILREGNC